MVARSPHAPGASRSVDRSAGTEGNCGSHETHFADLNEGKGIGLGDRAETQLPFIFRM